MFIIQKRLVSFFIVFSLNKKNLTRPIGGDRFVFEFSMTHSCEIALAAYKLEFLSVPNSDNPSSSPSMESTNYDIHIWWQSKWVNSAWNKISMFSLFCLQWLLKQKKPTFRSLMGKCLSYMALLTVYSVFCIFLLRYHRSVWLIQHFGRYMLQKYYVNTFDFYYWWISKPGQWKNSLLLAKIAMYLIIWPENFCFFELATPLQKVFR